jgi:hypothetical protein
MWLMVTVGPRGPVWLMTIALSQRVLENEPKLLNIVNDEMVVSHQVYPSAFSDTADWTSRQSALLKDPEYSFKLANV